MEPYEKLKHFRIEKGLTTYELSELTNIPQSTISKMENNKRKLDADSLAKLATALEIPIGVFFDDSTTVTNDDIKLGDKKSKNMKEEFPNDSDMRRIERARSKMNPKDKEKMMKILEASFEDYFDDED